MATAIPIQNIYYLLVYAWDYLEEADIVNVSGIDSSELVDLYAAVLWSGLWHLARRGLHQDYLAFESELAGIRGRIDVATTARRMLTQHGKAHCRFDELHVNTLPNQILVATARQLLQSPDLNRELRSEGQALVRSLREIRDISLTPRTFRSVQLYGNNRVYRFLLDLCKLIVDTSLITEEKGNFKFPDFVRDPKAMAGLYEKFLFNFFRKECLNAHVKQDRIRWTATSNDDRDLQMLPSMTTDITLRTPGRTIVIDAKFYSETLQKRFESAKIRSSNLYQLFAYLKNLESRGAQDSTAEGLLLYPVVDTRHRYRYEIQGHAVRIATVDLARPWKEIKSELLDLVA